MSNELRIVFECYRSGVVSFNLQSKHWVDVSKNELDSF